MSLTTSQVREFFDSPFYLEHGRFLIDVRATIVRALVGELSNKKIVDLGCGDASISIPLVGDSNCLTLVDLSPRMLSVAAGRVPDEARGRVQFVNSSLGDFEAPESFDVALCIGVLAHVPDIDQALGKISQCLKSDGKAIIEFTPNPNPMAKLLFPYYWLRRVIFRSDINPMGYATNKILLAEILRIAESKGLHLVQLKRHFFPLPTMAWWSQKWLYRYARFANGNWLMSKIGTECILLLTKTERTHS